MRFVDWDTGQRHSGRMVPASEGSVDQVLLLVREGEMAHGVVVDRLNTGSIGILEATRDELISLVQAGYRLTID